MEVMEVTTYVWSKFCYFQISEGKMWFDCKKQKGVLDKSFVPLKIPLHKENDYDEILQTCIEHVSHKKKTFLYILLL